MKLLGQAVGAPVPATAVGAAVILNGSGAVEEDSFH